MLWPVGMVQGFVWDERSMAMAQSTDCSWAFPCCGQAISNVALAEGKRVRARRQNETPGRTVRLNTSIHHFGCVTQAASGVHAAVQRGGQARALNDGRHGVFKLCIYTSLFLKHVNSVAGRKQKRIQRYDAEGKRERWTADDDANPDLQTLVKRQKHEVCLVCDSVGLLQPAVADQYTTGLFRLLCRRWQCGSTRYRRHERYAATMAHEVLQGSCARVTGMNFRSFSKPGMATSCGGRGGHGRNAGVQHRDSAAPAECLRKVKDLIRLCLRNTGCGGHG